MVGQNLYPSTRPGRSRLTDVCNSDVRTNYISSGGSKTTHTLSVPKMVRDIPSITIPPFFEGRKTLGRP